MKCTTRFSHFACLFIAGNANETPKPNTKYQNFELEQKILKISSYLYRSLLFSSLVFEIWFVNCLILFETKMNKKKHEEKQITYSQLFFFILSIYITVFYLWLVWKSWRNTFIFFYTYFISEWIQFNIYVVVNSFQKNNLEGIKLKTTTNKKTNGDCVALKHVIYLIYFFYRFYLFVFFIYLHLR